ncbi:hypothetical protein Salat_1420400 [Sesamum alatum]|uniref:Uncharacterized protein n=1 Tax=Sesamum alatum TaxID=300844 RepID=A0AAE1YAA9_9LAMI|nr:hypothetical protein Salat_1420400 [Sesamum alatum]
MDRAQEAIAASFSNNEEKYKEVFEMIDKRWDIQLHRPLHAAGYFLNSEFFYTNPNVEKDEEVMQGDVAQAAGVDEDAYDFRSRPSQQSKGKSKASSSKATKKASTSSRSTGHRHLIDDEEEEEDEEEEHFHDIDEEEADYISDDNGDDGEGSEDGLAELDD